ncbi:hypothetical protein CEXT_729371 [Caerostris extrusa]|uniref:Uncharacterized protein n=1 Tax=Caerostris extrusa TaxID=172846 RepID=A0AAV4NH99_CAEEX|nr:hypothetical protein CEXT_729371 [Caerostris extrusa]
MITESARARRSTAAFYPEHVRRGMSCDNSDGVVRCSLTGRGTEAVRRHRAASADVLRGLSVASLVTFSFVQLSCSRLQPACELRPADRILICRSQPN